MAPPNDAFASATTIDPSDDGSVNGTTISATTDNPAGSVFTGHHNVWYKFTAAVSGTVRFDTFAMVDGAGVMADSYLVSYVGTGISDLESLDAEDDHDDPASFRSQISVTVRDGLMYWIEVGGFDDGAFTLTWETFIPRGVSIAFDHALWSDPQPLWVRID